MIRLPEFLLKEMMGRSGIKIPRGGWFQGLPDGRELTQRLSPPLWGRVYAASALGHRPIAEQWLNSQAEVVNFSSSWLEHPPHQQGILFLELEEAIGSSLEYTLSLAFDPSGCPWIKLYGADKNLLMDRHIDYLDGLRRWEAIDFLERGGVDGKFLTDLSMVAMRAYQVFTDNQLLYLELSHLGSAAGNIQVEHAMASIEDDPFVIDHLVRQYDGGSLWFNATRTQQPEEKSAAGRGWTKNLWTHEPQGRVGLCCGGTGMSLMLLDSLYDTGLLPLNLTDLSAGVSENKLMGLLGVILRRPELEAFVMAINCLQFSRVDVYAAALVAALKEAKVDPLKIPVVVYLAGPGIVAARELLRNAPGIQLYTDILAFHDILQPLLHAVEVRQAGGVQ